MEELLIPAPLAEIDPDRQDLSYPALVSRRFAGTFPVDEWGFDRDLALLLAPFANLLPRPRVLDAARVPEVGPALVITDRWVAPPWRMVLAALLAGATGRPVRFAGVPDVAPFGPLLRRLGGVPGNLHDLRSLLRSGEVVVSSCGFDPRRPFGVGRPPEAVLAVAMSMGAPVVPAGVASCLPGQLSEVTLREPVRTEGASAPGTVEQLVVRLAERWGALSA
ncbi:hypothetical protein [Rhabdothermincola sediminis]|uniref:hypothetical protein n=1 Tax=Rhabdothermincola sediminis TaxID=2751370 RepID=UPI001AA07A8A|nr:hypothetical protein [Rhabdothermincola sediminis]